MVKHLLDRIIVDAGNKAGEAVKNAGSRLEKEFLEKKEIIAKEFEEKLDVAKKRIDREKEREISNFRMEKEKEFLELQNKFIAEVIARIKEKFDLFLKNNMKDIIAGFTQENREKECFVKVPETAGDMKIEGVTIEKDPGLGDAFLLEGKNWKLLFNWERFSSAIYWHIKEKTGRYLFDDNGKNRKDRRD